MTLIDYLNLITSAWRTKPTFITTLSTDLSPMVQVQNLMTSMVPIFDLDTAVGDQLDILGQWVGVSRNIAIPISGVYFSWDGADFTLGWDYGSWRPSDAPTSITSLPDDAYRTLIRAKIASNHWDGTTDGAYAIWDALFPNFTILIQDNQNMTYALGIVGGIIDSLSLALITGGYITLKPEGVRISDYFVAIDSGPVFAWDLDAPLLQGWNIGSWTREIKPT